LWKFRKIKTLLLEIERNKCSEAANLTTKMSNNATLVTEEDYDGETDKTY
jgi:hypothetical protein